MAFSFKNLDEILEDTLLLGSMAASIFVKNPNSQATAGKLINSVAQMLQVIEAQLGLAPTVPAATAATPATAVTATK